MEESGLWWIYYCRQSGWNRPQLQLQLLELFSNDQWTGRGRGRRSRPGKTDSTYYFQISESNWSWTLRFLCTGVLLCLEEWKRTARNGKSKVDEMTLTLSQAGRNRVKWPEPEVCLHSNRLSILKCLQLPIMSNDLGGRWCSITNDFCLTTLPNAIKSNGI